MTHARTLTRYACLAGLIAGLLVAVPSLAQQLPPSSPSPLATVTRVTGAGTSGSDILARVTANTKPQAIGSRIYWTQQVPVARSTLRTGGLSALARGIRHPAFTAAVIAAGLIIEGTDIFTESYPDNDDYGYSDNLVPSGQAILFNGNYYGSESAAIKAYADTLNPDRIGITYLSRDSSGRPRFRNKLPCSSCQDGYSYGSTRTLNATLVSYSGNTIDFEPLRAPASQEEIEQVDQHIEPELVEQLWNGQPIPEWQEAISVIGIPATEVESKGQDMPEVATKVAQRAANIISQLLGEEAPYPETETGGQTADDEMVDMWNEPIPDFPEAEPEWQVEEITSLPDFSFGLGSGSCPAPVTIAHPLGGSFTIEFQRLCDLASMIRGAVIAICMILALYIVLGTRATTS